MIISKETKLHEYVNIRYFSGLFREYLSNTLLSTNPICVKKEYSCAMALTTYFSRKVYKWSFIP